MELKPCFNCGSKELVVTDKEHIPTKLFGCDCHVYCTECGMSGPVSSRLRYAIENWNAVADKVKIDKKE